MGIGVDDFLSLNAVKLYNLYLLKILKNKIIHLTQKFNIL